MVIGIVLTIAVVMLAPRLLKSEGEDGFYRPRANPDAQPAPATAGDEEAPAAPAPARGSQAPAAGSAPAPLPATEPDYDFYTVLPGQEVPMTDAELAASARAEETRRQREAAQRNEDAAELARPATAATPAATPTPAPAAAPAVPTAPAASAAAAPAVADGARYLLQAGSFSASGDAEALKARIALLGLSARVESGNANGRTVYRVRMGPYGSATELADAKQKLDNGGLPALPIKVQ